MRRSAPRTAPTHPRTSGPRSGHSEGPAGAAPARPHSPEGRGDPGPLSPRPTRGPRRAYPRRGPRDPAARRAPRRSPGCRSPRRSRCPRSRSPAAPGKRRRDPPRHRQASRSRRAAAAAAGHRRAPCRPWVKAGRQLRLRTAPTPGSSAKKGGAATPAPMRGEHCRLRPVSERPWRGLWNASQSLPRGHRVGGTERGPGARRAGWPRRAALPRDPLLLAVAGPESPLPACQSTGAPLGQDTGPSATWRQIRTPRIRTKHRLCQTSFREIGCLLSDIGKLKSQKHRCW